MRDTWNAARWAVATTGSFREAVLAAANLGEDADTTAAVTGQIAGAHCGYSNTPNGWLERRLWRQEIKWLSFYLCGKMSDWGALCSTSVPAFHASSAEQ